MLFDREEIRRSRMFQLSGVTVTESELTGVLKNSIGYPLGVAITVRCMEGGKPYTSEMIAQAFQEVFLYFETAIYQRFDLPVQRFLLELAPFEQFDPEMARMVSGDPRAGELLDWLQRNTTMLRYDGILKFHFWPQFRRFLLWEMDREYTDEKRKTLFSRGGCITSCTRIIRTHWSATRWAGIIPRSPICSSAAPNCIRVWDSTASWKSITAACRRANC